MIKYVVVIAVVAGIRSAMPAGAEGVGVGVGCVGVTVGEGHGDRDSRDRDQRIAIKPSSSRGAITTEMLTMIADLLLSTNSNRI